MSMFILLMAATGLWFGFANKLPFLYSAAFLESGEPKTFLDKLLHCSYCLGFHCGWLTWAAWWAVAGSPMVLATGGPLWASAGVSCLLWAFACAAWCYLFDVGTKMLEGV
jgi:hypothetical protein